jgi:endonuclease/exonuclease/phosphatase family metal-dependent hydrolase
MIARCEILPRLPCGFKLAALITVAAAAIIAAGCSSWTRYRPDDTKQHRVDHGPQAPAPRDSFTVVCYNIQYGEDIDLALADLKSLPRLDDADVILLQEMDLAGVEQIASELQCNYFYQAASVSPHHGRLFGNAVLARWPIVAEGSIVLPNAHPLTGQRRIAVFADLDVAGAPVRAVSVHTSTIVAELPERIEQAAAVIDSLSAVNGPVIIGGDFNTVTDYGRIRTQRLFRKAGFRRAGRPTVSTVGKRLWFWPNQKLILDHLFYRGLDLGSAGVRTTATASDHLPLWARFGFPVQAD